MMSHFYAFTYLYYIHMDEVLCVYSLISVTLFFLINKAHAGKVSTVCCFQVDEG